VAHPGKRIAMPQWKYHITLHELPQSPCEEKPIIECDQTGECLVHDACRGGLEWLEDLFQKKGNDGWELVQSAYHHRELLCIWKMKMKD
jgi:hypothetical protein